MATRHVILLHGLCRTKRAMLPMANFLGKHGYDCWNIGYPSRSKSIAALSDDLAQVVQYCREQGAEQIDFVTHSMGGILLRSYLSRHPDPLVRRAVMLGPPSQGSEIVDKIGHWWLFKILNGPAGNEMHTGPDSIPNTLGPAPCEVGIIAGKRSVNWINSLLYLPGPDDGKITVERTKLEGMADHIVLPTTHVFMMRNRRVMRQTLHFLEHGQFKR